MSRLRIRIIYHLLPEGLQIPELDGVSNSLKEDILGYLDVKALLTMRCVNRSFSACSRDPKLWDALCYKDFLDLANQLVSSAKQTLDEATYRRWYEDRQRRK